MEIKKPTLLIDKAKCKNNIDQMIKKAQKANAAFRPHFKTHFSGEIGEWYKSKGVSQCTVSSVSMANYFADHGWKDITIAFPYNPLESEEINTLANKTTLSVLIESEESLDHIKENVKGKVSYYIKIDVGAHRTGIDPRNEEQIEVLVNGSSENIAFKGFYAHAGHTYGSADFESVKWIYDKSVKIMVHLKKTFGGLLSYGDTPSCSLIDDLSAFDELSPGNFVFYDWMQKSIGSCKTEDIAVCLVCPIVAIHKDRNEVVVYGGAVHLSKDRIAEKDIYEKTKTCFGKMVRLTNSGWSSEIKGHVDRLSQEHGIIRLSENEITHVKVGDLIGILPVHSCLTADMQGYYLSTDGDKIEKMLKN